MSEETPRSGSQRLRVRQKRRLGWLVGAHWNRLTLPHLQGNATSLGDQPVAQGSEIPPLPSTCPVPGARAPAGEPDPLPGGSV